MKKIQSLHFLRGIMTIIVLLAHLNSLYDLSLFNGIFIQGWSGVDFFFILSGFLLVYGYNGNVTVGHYLKKRIIRIVPAYWIYTLAVVLMTFFVNNLVSWIAIDFKGILKSLLFIPTNVAVNEMPIIPTAWTLPYEVFFYLIFLVLIIRGKRAFKNVLLLWFALIIGYDMIDKIEIGIVQNVYVSFLFSTLFIEFMMGVVIAVIARKNVIKEKYGIFCISIGVPLVLISWIGNNIGNPFVTDLHRWISFGIPYALIILGLVIRRERQAFRFSEKFDVLGNSSYSIYLTHYISILVFNRAIKAIDLSRFLGDAGVYVGFLVVGIASVAVGIGAYYLVERPISKQLSRLMMPKVTNA